MAACNDPESSIPLPPESCKEEASVLKAWLQVIGYGEPEISLSLAALNESVLEHPKYEKICNLHWPFPHELLPGGGIPPWHYRHRFYRIVAFELGWTECRVEGYTRDNPYPSDLLALLRTKTWLGKRPPEVEGETWASDSAGGPRPNLSAPRTPSYKRNACGTHQPESSKRYKVTSVGESSKADGKQQRGKRAAHNPILAYPDPHASSHADLLWEQLVKEYTEETKRGESKGSQEETIDHSYEGSSSTDWESNDYQTTDSEGSF